MIEWHQVWLVNVDGVWICSQCSRTHGLARIRLDRQHRLDVGEIVNRPQWQPAYNASKAAVHHLSRSLAAEWAPLGCGSMCSLPDTCARTWPPWMTRSSSASGSTTLRSSGSANRHELGPAVVFLASDDSSFMTGSVLSIDGGYRVF